MWGTYQIWWQLSGSGIALAWALYAVTKIIGLWRQPKRMPWPPPSLYEHWSKRVAVQKSADKRPPKHLFAIREFTRESVDWTWKDDPSNVARYLKAVDTYVETGDTELIPFIADTAMPLVENYETYYQGAACSPPPVSPRSQ